MRYLIQLNAKRCRGSNQPQNTAWGSIVHMHYMPCSCTNATGKYRSPVHVMSVLMGCGVQHKVFDNLSPICCVCHANTIHVKRKILLSPDILKLVVSGWKNADMQTSPVQSKMISFAQRGRVRARVLESGGCMRLSCSNDKLLCHLRAVRGIGHNT